MKTEVKNLGKWKDLAVETQCMWNIKTNVLPIIVE